MALGNETTICFHDGRNGHEHWLLTELFCFFTVNINRLSNEEHLAFDNIYLWSQ